MHCFITVFLLILTSAALAVAADGSLIESTRAREDVALTTYPVAAFWPGARPVYAEKSPHAEPLPRYRTEIRSRWTKDNLYVLFVCPYKELNLKPSPSTAPETSQLWDWDVAEVFIGSDFRNISAI
jgi:hypothetical protein